MAAADSGVLGPNEVAGAVGVLPCIVLGLLLPLGPGLTTVMQLALVLLRLAVTHLLDECGSVLTVIIVLVVDVVGAVNSNELNE